MSLTKISKERLRTCHPDLQKLILEVEKVADLYVLCGHRNKQDQMAAYEGGRSKLKWPQSKHNAIPSEAIDIAPKPLDWDATESFQILGEIVKKKADELDIAIRWGGDWETFKDYPHFELI